jgi:hypothetical protein
MKTTRIADLYADPGPFASVHIDVSRDAENADQHVELQARAVCDQLREQGAPDDVVKVLQELLVENTHTPAPVSRTVVATEAGGVLFDQLVHDNTEQPSASWGPLPDLGAWLQSEDSNTPFVLAVVNHEGGDVAAYVTDAAAPTAQTSVGDSSEIINKVKGGGWGHMRYQNATENVWSDNAAAVVDEIRSHVRKGFRLILLAGDPKSRSMVRELLGDSGPGELLDIEEGGGRSEDGGDEVLQEAVRERLAEHAVAHRLEVNRELEDRLGRDHAVATGVRDVADAFVRGQVDTLLIDPSEAARLELDPANHPGLVLGSGPVDAPVRADLALVAAAAMTSAEVTIAPSETIGGVPVAALLRWDQPAEGTR